METEQQIAERLGLTLEDLRAQVLIAQDVFQELLYEETNGDPRRCPRHQVPTSSPDGMFDAPCNLCEAEQESEF